jgi:hypothetical protein
MSAGPADKKRRVQDDSESEEEVPAVRIPWHTVILSNFGDQRPDETVPDVLTAFLFDLAKSVSTYIVVPDFGPKPLFLAKHRYLYAEDVYENGERTRAKGDIKKQYVKMIVPRTADLCFVGNEVEVMFILSHGCPRTALSRPPQPSYLSFHEPFSVSADGKVIVGNSPETSRIWSCASHVAENAVTKLYDVYRKPAQGVTLSQVVGGADLVVLLSCDTGRFMDEYSAENADEKKPDFIAFLRWGPTCDTSFFIFLALMYTTLEKRVAPTGVTKAGKTIFWDDTVRMTVCQVILWVRDEGRDADAFWDFLCANKIVEMIVRDDKKERYRIRGCLQTYGLGLDAETKQPDKVIVLEELRSLTLMIWHNGDGGPGHYDNIDHRRQAADLEGWRDGKLDLRDYQLEQSAPASPVRAAGPAAQDAHVGVLLRQLDGLAC